MATRKSKAAKAKTWEELYEAQVLKPGCGDHHHGATHPVPCSAIFPMDCPQSWPELCKALKMWGRCWEEWGKLTYDEIQNSAHCGGCHPELILPPNPICAICEAMKGLHAQWTLWAVRVNALTEACSSGPNHIPPPPPPFK